MAGIAYLYRSKRPPQSHDYLFPIVHQLIKGTPPGATVLDLGCGNGSFISNFRSAGWKLHGTDFSPTGIEVARSSFPEINFFLSDATSTAGDLARNIGSADVVVSTEVIEHVYSPRGFLRNAHSLLKPGGMLVISTPYHGYLKNLALAATNSMDKHFTALRDHGHIKFWSRKTLTSILNETGFTDIHFYGAGRLPYLWKSMVLQATKPAD
jgi:2-polyprenyl-6-hydroxyphenyl methylase/3-demethylubiquinone-9 3-methyltransferase